MAKPRSRKLVLRIVSVIVVVVVVLSVLSVYYSPEYSWSNSVRDRDGDGVADKSDPEPLDASIWGLCEGYVNLTIYNNSTDTIDFTVRASSSDLIQNISLDHVNTTLPHSNLTQLLKLNWLGGPVSTNVSVSVIGIPYDWFYHSWYNESLMITNAHITTVALVCPDDFAPNNFYY